MEEASTELDIGRYLRLIYKKRVLFALSAMAVTAAVVIIGYLMPKEYEAKSTIVIERNFLNDLIKNITITPSFEEKIKALSTVMLSRGLVLKVMGDLDLDTNGKSPQQIEGLLKNFQDKTAVGVQINKMNKSNTDLFIVSYRDTDPKLAANYVNLLVRRYIEENLSLKREEAYGANRFIMEQIDIFKDKIDRADAEIARGAVSADRLQPLQKKLQELLVQYTEDHPNVIRLKMEIEELKKSKGHAAKTRVSEAKAQANGPAAEAESGGRVNVPDIPAGKKDLKDLVRDRDSNKKIYEELLATLARSEVSTQVEVQDKAGAFRILDPAVVPRRPISPNMLKIILLGVLGGIAAGIGLIVGLDYLDTSVRSVETVKKLGLPVLAVIPAIQTQQETEAIRKKDGVLYTAIGLYLMGLLVVVTVETMELAYIDDFVNAARTEISNSLKKTRLIK